MMKSLMFAAVLSLSLVVSGCSSGESEKSGQKKVSAKQVISSLEKQDYRVNSLDEEMAEGASEALPEDPTHLIYAYKGEGVENADVPQLTGPNIIIGIFKNSKDAKSAVEDSKEAGDDTSKDESFCNVAAQYGSNETEDREAVAKLKKDLGC